MTAHITTETGVLLTLTLRQDNDEAGRWRWICQGEDTEVSGTTPGEAIAAARAAWDQAPWHIQFARDCGCEDCTGGRA